MNVALGNLDVAMPFTGVNSRGQAAFVFGKPGTFAMPILLAKLGPDPSLRLPLLGVLARRPLPNISCASASFFLRRRSVVLSHVHHQVDVLAMRTSLYDVVKRDGLFICRHG